MVDLATCVDSWTDRPAAIYSDAGHYERRGPVIKRTADDPMRPALAPQNVQDTDQEVVRSAISDNLWMLVAAEHLRASKPDLHRVARVLRQLREIISEPDPQEVLSNRIASFGALPKGWDGEDGVPLSKAAIAEGLAFLSFLNLSRSVPHVSVAGDGELAFIWDRDDRYLEVSFYGDGELYFFRRGNERQEPVTGSLAFTGKSMPREIDALIREMG